MNQPDVADSATDDVAEIELVDVETINVENSPMDDVFNPMAEDADETPKTRSKKVATGVPSVDEWQDFIGRIVLSTVTDLYLDYALKGISDQLSDRELRQIRLSKQDLKEMAAPIATLAQGSKFARKRGRAIIAASDSVEAVIVMVLWMKKVNKIAKKYRPARSKSNNTVRGNVVNQQTAYPQQEAQNGTAGQFQEQGPGYGVDGPGIGYPLFNPGTG